MSVFDLENPNEKAGDALRDEAANLLANVHGAAKTEVRVAGKKVDVFFEVPQFGKRMRIYVDAKDLGRRLHRSDLVTLWSDYSGIVDRNKPAALLVISRHGLSTDAQAYVEEQSGLLHQSIWELENEILGLSEYHRYLLGLFEEDGLDRYYIEARARRVAYSKTMQRELGEETNSLFQTVVDWVDGTGSHPIAILGGYGAGKSSLAKRLASFQAARALKDPLVRRPVLVKLGSFGRYSSIEGMLGAMFGNDFPVHAFSIRHFMEMNRKGRLLIILDGFDEMKHAMSWADFRAQVADLNRFTGAQSKVLLLGRPSAFMSDDEHIYVLRGRKRFDGGWHRLPNWPEFEEYELTAFDASERAEFVRRYLSVHGGGAHSDEWIEARAAEVNDLADREPAVFEKPVHARILTDLALDPQVDLARLKAGVSRWSLYDLFYCALGEREAEKENRRPIAETLRRDFLRRLAYWLWAEKHGAISFHAADIPMVRESGDDPYEAEGIVREFLTGAALERKSGDLYYFGHRSFAEFLVAERLTLNDPTPVEQARYSQLVRDGVLSFLNEAPEKSFVRRWAAALPQAQGEIHLGYLAFLAQHLGGVDKLRDLQPKGSVWRALLRVFEGEILIAPENMPRILKALRTSETGAFWLLLQLFQRHAPLMPEKYDASVDLIAALLDRVFLHGELDSNTRRIAVAPTADTARQLARVVLPEVKDYSTGRFFTFAGPKLAEAHAMGLRSLGVEVGVHEPSMMRTMSNSSLVRLDSVIAKMDEAAGERAGEYFRWYGDWGGVFVRSVRENNRKARKPHNKR